MPSSPNTETGTRLTKRISERHNPIAREYFEVIEFLLCGLIFEKVEGYYQRLSKKRK